MERIDKCRLAVEKGYTYNPETGEITGVSGKVITNKDGDGYGKILVYVNKKQYQLLSHIFAWYVMNNEVVEEIDHINGIRYDNRIINLRSVTCQQNHFNRTKAKGYCWHKNANKWKSQIKLNGKDIHLGYYINEEDARQAYLDAKEKYHII